MNVSLDVLVVIHFFLFSDIRSSDFCLETREARVVGGNLSHDTVVVII